jgi:spore maturation protein CgeB
MRRAGYSPSVRIFEAAACGTPIISDYWRGLEDFFELEKEILTASTTAEMLVYLNEIPEKERRAMGERARRRVLANHTPEQRALELESYVNEVMKISMRAIA